MTEQVQAFTSAIAEFSDVLYIVFVVAIAFELMDYAVNVLRKARGM